MIIIHLRFKIPEVTERHPRDPVPVWRSSNLVFTIWAVFGGFILHFLLSNFLTVLLKPRYEEFVENAEDLIKRNITPFIAEEAPGEGIEEFIKLFSDSPDPNYQELSKRLEFGYYCEYASEYATSICNCTYCELIEKARLTGKYAQIASYPNWREDHKQWYRSKETVSGMSPFYYSFSNKKWPLKKVNKLPHGCRSAIKF